MPIKYYKADPNKSWMQNGNRAPDIKEVWVFLPSGPEDTMQIGGVSRKGVVLNGSIKMEVNTFAQICKDFLEAYVQNSPN